MSSLGPSDGSLCMRKKKYLEIKSNVWYVSFLNVRSELRPLQFPSPAHLPD